MKGKGWQIALLACVMGLNAKAQGWLVDENTIETNWNITLQTGTAALVNEIRSDFSGVSKQINNKPGWAVNVSLAKMLFERFDIGLDLGYLQLTGYNNNPSGIPYLNEYPKFYSKGAGFLPYPIQYQSSVFSAILFSKYNFINFSSFSKGYINLNMYVRGGIGMGFLSGELGYSEHGYYPLAKLQHPLHAVNRYGYQNTLPKFIFCASTGINYQINTRLFLSLELMLQTISSQEIDVLPNYRSTLNRSMSAEEINLQQESVFGFSGKFMLGTTYFFNFNSQKKKQLKYLPFYHNRYRSYYSRFHTAESKKARKENKPFYTDKLKKEVPKK